MARSDSLSTGTLWSKKKIHCVETTLFVCPPVTKHQRRTVRRIFMKFGIVVYQILTDKRDFHENCLSDLHTSFRAICEFLFILSIFLDGMDEIRYRTPVWCRRVTHWLPVNCKSIGVVKDILNCVCKLMLSLISKFNLRFIMSFGCGIFATGDQAQRNVMWPVLWTGSEQSVLG
jgi:hypothetical protein